MNRSELEELYRRYGDIVHRRARGILRDDDQARDVLQDVFVQVIKSISTFRGEASPVTWIYRITTNLCLNRLRDRSTQRQKLQVRALGQATAQHPSSDERVDVMNLLHELPSELSEPAIYYHLDGMSQQEIADLLHVPRRTVSYRLTRFAEKARELLEGSTPLAAEEVK